MIQNLLAAFSLLVAFGAAPHPLAGQELRLGPGSALWLEGDSTLHVFSATSSAVRLFAKWKGEIPKDSHTLLASARRGDFEEFLALVPAASLKSGKAGLDKNMHKALRAREHPFIRFRVTGLTLDAAPVFPEFQLQGTLTIAGRDAGLSIPASLRAEGQNIYVEGSHELLMSDFGIAPPLAFLGAIKTRDRIKVLFKLNVAPGPEGVSGVEEEDLKGGN